MTDLTRHQAEKLAARLKALADPTRLQILALLRHGELTQFDIRQELDRLSQPTMAHHLRLLFVAGLVEREKRSVWMHYRLVPGALLDLMGDLP